MKLIFLGMLLTLSLSCQSQECFDIEVVISKVKFDTKEKKEIVFFVKNKMDKVISLPVGLYEGVHEDEDAEFYLEVLKKESKNTYTEVERSNNDYQNVLGNRKFCPLKYNEIIKYYTDMDLLHNLKSKGIYKVRVVLRSDKFVSCQHSESPWKEFEIY